MSVKFQLRRDTAANWSSVNPTLSQGEPGLETDTGRMKIGDGTTAWNAMTTSVLYKLLSVPAAVATALLTMSSFVQSILNAANQAAFRSAIGCGSLADQDTIDLASEVTGNLSHTHFNGGAGASSTTYLRGDDVWATPPGGGTGIADAASDGNTYARKNAAWTLLTAWATLAVGAVAPTHKDTDITTQTGGFTLSPTAHCNARIPCNGTFNVTTTSAATLGGGFVTEIVNIGSGVITIVKTGGTNQTLNANQACLLFVTAGVLYALPPVTAVI